MLELNKIYNLDCLCGMAQLDDNSIDLILTSPPYFAFKDYGEDPRNIENLAHYEDYITYLSKWLRECYRVLSEDGRLCIIIDDKHTNMKTEGENRNRGTHARLILSGEEAGLTYKDLVIWAKARAGHASGGSNLMLGSYPYPPNIPMVNWFEYILIFRKGGRAKVSRITGEQKAQSKLTFKEFKWASESIWKIPPEREQNHPCPFPEEIARRLIKLFSFVGDTVLNPFVGSGTTAMVAKQLQRNYIGFDLNPTFCKVSENRLSQSILTSIQHK